MNLKEDIVMALERNGESESDIEVIHVGEGWSSVESDIPDSAGEDGAYVADLDELDYNGKGGFGGESFHPFYLYTEDRIYFKQVYDGLENVVSVPRHPDENEAPRSIGG